MNRLVLTAALLSGITVAAAAQAGHEHRSSDSAFHAMQQRGKTAMGVDQYQSAHRFDPLPDGGRIQLESDLGDQASVAAIRQHFRDIATSFEKGDFTTPFFVHDQQVPGTGVMRAKRDRLRYQVFELPRGGGLRITTADRDAIAAIHEFLAFQRREHH